MSSPATTNRLRDLRLASGESKVDLAQALGLRNIVQIERWERGQEIPTSRAREIARRYGVTLSHLMCDEAEAA